MKQSRLVKRFLNYVSFDTQSDESSETCPSTEKQKLLAQELVREMQSIGIEDARMDEHGYVYGSVPGKAGAPVIGLIAHMDTSPDSSGKNVKPRIIEYHGGDLVLNEELGVVLQQRTFRRLRQCVGKHLIVTDGTTLLGADDKAGVAEIMTAVAELIAEGAEHAPIRIAFTPDEEIGRGTDHFDVEGFGVDYAYTVDGGGLGGIEYENFNAADAYVTVHGISIHPGIAKNKLLNSQLVAMEFHNMLPPLERPEQTEGYEGFSMLSRMEGSIEKTVMHYIIRDHDLAKFEAKKNVFLRAAKLLDRRYGKGTVELKLRDSYYNMKQKVLPCMYIVDRAMKAMRKAGFEPVVTPIRGGTDGARLSYVGIPCPNLCTGSDNCHGRYEYACVEDMMLCVQMLKNILTDEELFA